jgi:hypothetical protein
MKWSFRSVRLSCILIPENFELILMDFDIGTYTNIYRAIFIECDPYNI